MSKVIIIKEKNDKTIYANCIDTVTNINKKYRIKSFEVNEDIINLTFRKEKLFIFLTNDNTIILPDPNVIENKILKNLKKKVRSELFKRACNYYIKRTKLSLSKIQIEGKIATASVLTAVIAFTSAIVIDKGNNINAYNDAGSMISMQPNTSVIAISNISQKPKIKSLKIEPIEIELLEPKYTEEEQIIMKYADMYFINYIEAANYVEENMDLVNQYDSFELGVLTCLKDYHWNDENIDKTPMMSSLTEEEKERFILEIANVYGMTDEEALSVLIAVHRLETFYGTSDIYLNLNNCGGVMEYSDNLGRQIYIEYKTFEIGAESFVRTFLKVKDRVLEKARNNEEGFNVNWSLARNMDSVYCGNVVPEGQQSWHELAEEIVEKVIDSGILNDYIEEPNRQLKLN